MPTDRSNKQPWAQTLDELMPRSLDKAAAWEKLQQKLEGKKSRNKPALFWIMGLSIAASVFLFFLFSPSKRSNIDPVPRIAVPVVAKKEIPAPAVIVSAKKNSTQPTAILSKTNKILFKKVSGTVPDEPVMLVEEKTPVQLVPNDTFSSVKPAIVTAPVIKKKMRVVHNNELGQPPIAPTQPEAIAKSTPIIFKNILKPLYQEISTDIIESNSKEIKPRRTLPFSSLSQKN